ncbi:MAG: hypothetical protein ACXAEX_03750 [Promethearchaeota archaeon]|jgi:hypothetical protein
MGNKVGQDNVILQKFNEISKQISLQIISSILHPQPNKEKHNNFYKSRTKIVILVAGKPIISIPSKIFPSFEQAIQELNSNLDDDEDPNDNELSGILYQKLVLILNSWILSGYDTQFLHYKIAFPLLKELRKIGETKFQIIFQQEILKSYATRSTQIKDYLEYEGYLKLIGDFF